MARPATTCSNPTCAERYLRSTSTSTDYVRSWAITCTDLFSLAELKPQTIPNASAKNLQEFSKAATDLQPCLAISNGAGAGSFARDLISLEVSNLVCLQHNLQALANLDTVPPTDVQMILDSYQPIVGLLELAVDFFQLAGVSIPKAPTLVDVTNPDWLVEDQNAIADYIADLRLVLGALGGSP